MLNYNTTQGLFFAGNFWGGRATGMKLQTPDAEQAQGPPVDPLEMGNPDIACTAYKISQAPYLPLFELVWGDSFNIHWPANTAKICVLLKGRSAATPRRSGSVRTTAPRLISFERSRNERDWPQWS